MKRIKHIERLSDPKYVHEPKYKVEKHVVSQIVQDIDKDLQRPVYKSKFVTRPDDDLVQYKVSDFCLDNLKVSGAIDNLKNLSLSRDPLSASAHCDKIASQIINSSNENN